MAVRQKLGSGYLQGAIAYNVVEFCFAIFELEPYLHMCGTKCVIRTLLRHAKHMSELDAAVGKPKCLDLMWPGRSRL